MKRICLISTVTETNGAFLVPMAEYFHQHTDWDISLMCAPDDPEYLKLVPEGVHFIPMPMRRGISIRGLSACFRMWKVFRKEKFDMIQYCTPNASLYASLAGWMARVPMRLYCQWGMIFVSFPRGIKRWIFKTMEKTICALSTHVQPDSHGNLKMCHELGLYPDHKGSVVWNGSTCGIDLEKFDLSRKEQWRQEIRRRWDIPENAMVFGFVGRITGDKGVNELFEAFRQMTEKNENLYLLMIGPLEKEESVNMELYRWAQNHPRVRLCGFQNGVERFLAAMDCYVLPSYREGFGTSIIEAEAMELPIIATNIPGPTEAMCENLTGILVEARSTESLLAGMERMAADPAALERFGKAGRAYVAERFEKEKFLQATLKDRAALLEYQK